MTTDLRLPFHRRLRAALRCFWRVLRDEPAGVVLLSDASFSSMTTYGNVAIGPEGAGGTFTFEHVDLDPSSTGRWVTIGGSRCFHTTG